MIRRAFPILLIAFMLAGCSSTDSTGGEPPPIYETGIDSDAWTLVPAGDFLFGIHNHMTSVDHNFEAMVTTVTNAQYAAYLNEALEAGSLEIVDDEVVGYYRGDAYYGDKHEEKIEAGNWLHVALDEPGLRIAYMEDVFSPVPGYENRPMVHVTWFGAKAFCEYYRYRLPTEVEWEKAARGEDGRPYPWGDGVGPQNANYYSSHDIFEKTFGKMGDTTPVGFYNGQEYDGFHTEDSSSPYGLYDMAGNVWQWADDVYEGQHYRYMRGGSKADYAFNLRVWTRNSAGPEFHGPSVGFRCIKDAGSE